MKFFEIECLCQVTSCVAHTVSHGNSKWWLTINWMEDLVEFPVAEKTASELIKRLKHRHF